MCGRHMPDNRCLSWRQGHRCGFHRRLGQLCDHFVGVCSHVRLGGGNFGRSHQWGEGHRSPINQVAVTK